MLGSQYPLNGRDRANINQSFTEVSEVKQRLLSAEVKGGTGSLAALIGECRLTSAAAVGGAALCALHLDD